MYSPSAEEELSRAPELPTRNEHAKLAEEPVLAWHLDSKHLSINTYLRKKS